MDIAVLAAVAASTIISGQWVDITPVLDPPASLNLVVAHPTEAGKLLAFRNYFSSALVLASSDGGRTWTNPLTATAALERVFVHPGRPGLVFAQETYSGSIQGGPTFGGGLLRSLDFGATWSRVHEGADARMVSPFASDPANSKRLFATRRTQSYYGSFGAPYYLPSFDDGIVESLDDGASWRTVGTSPPPSELSYADLRAVGPTPSTADRFYMTNSRGGYVSRDAGRTWGLITSILGGVQWVKPDPLQAASPYLFQAFSSDFNRFVGRVLRSDDDGLSWTPIFEAARNGRSIAMELTIDPTDNNRLWVTDGGKGVSFSADRGITWQSVGYPGPMRDFSDMGAVVISPSDPMVAYITVDGRLYRGDFSAAIRGQPVPAIEYYSASTNHFWMAASPAEALAQDYRGEPGAIVRTGKSFGVWADAASVPGEALGVCEFQGDPALGLRSRFLTTEGGECETLKRGTAWRLEGEGIFYVAKPQSNGTCAAGLVGVRRFYNRLADANHRYVTEAGDVAAMRGYGWADEGIVMCAARP
jgi:photosystem II stability/assembly factor-like uncharacterized protein